MKKLLFVIFAIFTLASCGEEKEGVEYKMVTYTFEVTYQNGDMDTLMAKGYQDRCRGDHRLYEEGDLRVCHNGGWRCGKLIAVGVRHYKVLNIEK